jgi:hypothetical protein
MDHDRGGIDPARNYRPREVGRLEGVGDTTVYGRVARGEYGEVYKDGPLTLIPGQGIIDRRKRNLKPATYGARKGVRGVPKAEAASARRARESLPP